MSFLFLQAGREVDMSPFYHDIHSLMTPVIPEMVDAIQCIRAEGIKTALLTNNWLLPDGNSMCPVDKSLFDIVSL